MTATALVLAAAAGGFVPPVVAVQHFPGTYFTSRAREPLHREVMTAWPGPTELVRLWREAELSERQRVALLLGSAAFHDPVTLPLYREAIMAESRILRQAAIYAYRDCIADVLVNVDVTIDARIQESYARQMRLMDATLRRHSLVEVWLQSALAQKGASLPGYRGLQYTRSQHDCMRAVEKLIDVQDLDFLITAYELSEDQTTRVALLQLIEGITLNRFLIVPTGEKAGWGMHVYNDAHSALKGWIQQWRLHGCRVDGEAALTRSLRKQGVKIADPLGPDAWRVWLTVLRKGRPQWWPLAARRLYACGGPWYELSILHSDTRENRARRDNLDRWYRSFSTGRVSSGKIP
jgi:hypothetical protein